MYSLISKVIIFFCRQPKPKNRPSFRQISLHLDLAAGALLATPPETYLADQEQWRVEINDNLSKLRSDGIPTDFDLIHRREEELKHAQDVRSVYEDRLQSANKLYNDLRTCQSHLDSRELELKRCV